MRHLVCCIALFTIGPQLQAEQVFISDKLVVGVYTEANQESERLTTLESGAAVEALEKTEGFTRVKLSDGREGWVRSTYLTTQTPAVVRVRELEKERGADTTAISELQRLKEINTTLANELAALKSEIHTRAQENQPSIGPPESPSRVSVVIHVIKWTTAIALAAGVLGFALGHRRIAKRIERKYGKLKIY